MCAKPVPRKHSEAWLSQICTHIPYFFCRFYSPSFLGPSLSNPQVQSIRRLNEVLGNHNSSY